MEREINGICVEIDNIELIKLGYIGLIEDRQVVQSIDTAELSKLAYRDFGDTIENITRLYRYFYNKMPFPLYAADLDDKYNVLGKYINSKIKSRYRVNNGLEISIADGIGIKFVNRSFGIVALTEFNEHEYTQGDWADEYDWIYEAIINNNDTSEYYMEFMPGIYFACDGELNLIRSEISKLMCKQEVPHELKLNFGELYDVGSGAKIKIDLYKQDKIPTNKRISIYNGKMDNQSRVIEVDNFKYTMYLKKENERAVEVEIVRLYGVAEFIRQMCIEREEEIKFRGIIIGNNAYIEIDDYIYSIRVDKIERASVLATGCNIYSVDSQRVYIRCTNKIDRELLEECIYSINSNNVEVCSIKYNKVV